MNKTLKWILIGLGIALAAFLVALPIFGMVLHGGRLGTGLMTPDILGRAGRGMMLVPMFGFFGFLRVLLPVGVVALAVVGIVLLVRGNHTSKAGMVPPPVLPTEELRVCKSCGKTLAAEGEYCPFCGTQQ